MLAAQQKWRNLSGGLITDINLRKCAKMCEIQHNLNKITRFPSYMWYYSGMTTYRPVNSTPSTIVTREPVHFHFPFHSFEVQFLSIMASAAGSGSAAAGGVHVRVHLMGVDGVDSADVMDLGTMAGASDCIAIKRAVHERIDAASKGLFVAGYWRDAAKTDGVDRDTKLSAVSGGSGALELWLEVKSNAQVEAEEAASSASDAAAARAVLGPGHRGPIPGEGFAAGMAAEAERRRLRELAGDDRL